MTASGQAGFVPEVTAQDAPEVGGKDFKTKYMRLNVGPQHPSTHGNLEAEPELHNTTGEGGQ